MIGSGAPGFPKTAPPITVIAKENRIKIDRPGGNRIRPTNVQTTDLYEDIFSGAGSEKAKSEKRR